MRWTIAAQFDDGAGDETAEVLTLEREIDPPFSMLGLLNREGKTLLLRLQERFVGQQGPPTVGGQTLSEMRYQPQGQGLSASHAALPCPGAAASRQSSRHVR